MSVYMITYFISSPHNHNHDESCSCGEDHTYSHSKENCNCDTANSINSNEDLQREDNLIGKIKSLGAWAQFLPEGFFVKSNSSAHEIFAEISSVTNKSDIVFVTKIDPKSSACANPSILNWLTE